MAPVTIIHVAHDRCEACGRRHRSVLTLGHAFRQREIRAGRSDPGLLCFGCAELWANVLRTGSSKRQMPWQIG
jgi:hypothetical protein